MREFSGKLQEMQWIPDLQRAALADHRRDRPVRHPVRAVDLHAVEPFQIAHRIALGFLDEARAGCVRLNHPDDPEALHDFRVAIRRLRSTLKTWQPILGRTLRKKHRRILRHVMVATGSGRDAEVALAWLATVADDVPDDARPGFDWIVTQLRERLGACMAEVRGAVVEAFDHAEGIVRPALETAKLRVDLRPEADGDARTGADVVAGLTLALDEELFAYLDAIEGIADEEQAHDARIIGKRLRYHVEPFRASVPEARAVVKACKELQDVLGDMNDCFVLRSWIRDTGATAPADAGPGIDWTLARIAQRHAELYERLEAGWLADGVRALRDPVAAFVHAAEGGRRPVREIERTYLLSQAPALPSSAESREIEQGYLPVEGFEERVRRSTTAEGTKITRTLKVGTGLSRFEAEHRLEDDAFAALWPLTAGRRIHKRRHIVVAGSHVWEIDEYLDRDLWLAEVELAAEEEEAELPAWLAAVVVRDVTETGEYANRRLAR